jgi:hypothetical protein
MSRSTRAVTAPTVAARAAAGTRLACTHGQQRGEQSAPAAQPDGGVVCTPLGQPRHLDWPLGEHRHARERGRQSPGERQQQVVATGQVRSLVRDHGRQLRRVKYRERGGGQHDRAGASWHAVGGQLRVIEHNGGAGYRARYPAAGNAGGPRMRPGLPLGSLHPAPVSPGRRGSPGRSDKSGHAQHDLERRATVHRRRARPARHRTAHGFRQPWPAKYGRPDQTLHHIHRAGQNAGHRHDPRRHSQPGAHPARRQVRQRARQAPGERRRVADHDERGAHPYRRSASRRTTDRSTSDSCPSIWATK